VGVSVTVIVVGFVSATLADNISFPLEKDMLPEDVNWKFAGAVRIIVPKPDMSLFKPSVIIIFPNVYEVVGKVPPQAYTVSDGAVMVTFAKVFCGSISKRKIETHKVAESTL
jgi:hypothetical protein